MKNITLIIAGLFFVGCAHLTVKTPTWSMSATSFCKDIQIPKVTVTMPGSAITVEGYKSDVNSIALQNVTDSVVSMIIRAGMNAVVK